MLARCQDIAVDPKKRASDHVDMLMAGTVDLCCERDTCLLSQLMATRRLPVPDSAAVHLDRQMQQRSNVWPIVQAP
eukprot:6194839-Pleurochrysis_carterae.AAC.1